MNKRTLRRKMMMKKILTISLLSILLTACEAKWEYKVVHFDRDTASLMELELEGLGDEGWEYAGPLANNGINAQFVAFKRKK